MLSKIPIDIGKIKPEDIDKEILRAALIAELDAINLYEEMAALTKNNHIKTVLLDVAQEEKEHGAQNGEGDAAAEHPRDDVPDGVSHL